MRELILPLHAAEATDAGRFGPKAANQAALGQAGLPIPGGYCLDAEAYRIQLRALGLESSARLVFTTDGLEARRHALDIRLGLLDQPVDQRLRQPLLDAWRALTRAAPETLGVVRSSALVEDRFESSFAGQFESFLGLENESEFLTAVRSCWCALWASRALRYMATYNVDPAELAMGLLIQPLIQARVSGGGLSRTAEGNMELTATLGLGSAIAQGEVVPDRYVVSRDGVVRETAVGRKYRRGGCVHGPRPADRKQVEEPCLDSEQVLELADLLTRSEDVIGGPTEIEWAMDDSGFKLLQARPLHVEAPYVSEAIWEQHPRLKGHPAGIGWATGRARVVSCECELARVGPGEVLVTRVAGPSLSQVLPRVSAVVAELGGSTSHLAALARERGIPMVLGVLDATHAIPDGSMVAVDGVAGIVRWMQ